MNRISEACLECLSQSFSEPEQVEGVGKNCCFEVNSVSVIPKTLGLENNSAGLY